MGHFDTSGLQGAADSLTEQGIDVLRLGYSDLIGTDRGRDILVNRMPRTVSSGVAFCRSIYGTTPRGETADVLYFALAAMTRAGAVQHIRLDNMFSTFSDAVAHAKELLAKPA